MIAPTISPAEPAGVGGGEHRSLTFELEALPHLDGVYRFALSLTRDATYADDLVQETMLRAFRSWHRYEPGTNIRAWLFTILRNIVISDYRRRRLDWHSVAFDEVESFRILDESQESDPEKPILNRFISDEVLSAIRDLPEDYRAAVVLRDVEGLSYAEIARVVGVPVGTIKSRLFRARQLLQDRLRDFALAVGYGEAAVG